MNRKGDLHKIKGQQKIASVLTSQAYVKTPQPDLEGFIASSS